MGQTTSGIRSMLSFSAIYNGLQNIMGARRRRYELVDEFVFAGADCKILDLGCGTSEILDCLPNDIEYWGYDISAQYIAAAKAKYGIRGHFHCGLLDKSELAGLPKFDRVLAIGVLHHLDDDEARALFSLSYDALKDGGRLITMDPCWAVDQGMVARYLISKDRGLNVRTGEAYTSLAKCSFESVESTLRHRSWIPYTHWIMECYK